MVTGYDYENYCANYLKSIGFKNVKVTKASNDQGVDIIANKDGYKYAIQCKYYSNPVGNSAIQEVVAGAELYHCDKKMVITNNVFTKSAVELAESNNVILIDSISVEKTYSIEENNYFNSNVYKEWEYSSFCHNLMSPDYYIASIIDAKDYNCIYREYVITIEKDYLYLRHKKITKYKPTDSYNESKFNRFIGINDEMNKAIEEIIKTILRMMGIVELSFDLISSEMKNDKGVLSIKFVDKRNKEIDYDKMNAFVAYTNYLSIQCSFRVEREGEGVWLHLEKKKVKDRENEYNKFIDFRNKYKKNNLINLKLNRVKNQYLCKKYFDSLEDEMYNKTARFLLERQKKISTKYILKKLYLLSAEYNGYDGLITFYYYVFLDWKFYIDPRTKKYRTSTLTSNAQKECVLLISLSMYADEISIINEDISTSNISEVKIEHVVLEDEKKKHIHNDDDNYIYLSRSSFVYTGTNFDDIGI